VTQEEFKQGDRVEWNTPQGKTRGTVNEKLTSETEVGGQSRERKTPLDMRDLHSCANPCNT
jgi:Hypervirulence associated proteins TUDOR domain